MKKISIIACVAALSAVVLLSGCQKERVTSMNSIAITAEHYNGGEKAYINGFYANWEDGDPIMLTRYHHDDGTTTNHSGSISITSGAGNPHAEASAGSFTTAEGDVVWCGYPGTLFGSGIGDVNNISYLPETYTYSVSNGNQNISCPMVGKLTIEGFVEPEPNPNTMLLRNLYCLLRIKVEPPDEGTFVLDSIVVVNTSASPSPMSGAGTITFTDGTPTLAMTGTASVGNRDRVILTFGGLAQTINATRYFYVPIPPMPAGQELKILIHNKVTGNWKYNAISTEQAIPGNGIATIDAPSTTESAPSEYEFFDWIENTDDASYIDLGIAPTNAMKMELTFMLTNSANYQHSSYYAGSRGNAGSGKINFGFSASGSGQPRDFRCYYMCSKTSDSSQFACTGSQMVRQLNVKYRHSIETRQDNSGKYFCYATFQRFSDNLTLTRSTPAIAGGITGSPSNIYVFGMGSNRQERGMRMYSFVIYVGGNAYRNFTPCRKYDDPEDRTAGWVDGVYDAVSGTFIDPSSTGNFVVGNDD